MRNFCNLLAVNCLVDTTTWSVTTVLYLVWENFQWLELRCLLLWPLSSDGQEAGSKSEYIYKASRKKSTGDWIMTNIKFIFLPHLDTIDKRQ